MIDVTLTFNPRPRMKVQGIWLQSIALVMFVADIHICHDSSMTCEACVVN